MSLMALPLEDDMAYFVILLRYIHQNPVKAGIVKNSRLCGMHGRLFLITRVKNTIFLWFVVADWKKMFIFAT